MNTTLVALLLAGLGVAPALAENTGEAPGAATRGWLQLQAEGRQASTRPQTLSGEAMERIYRRYLGSFATPIPLRLGSTGSAAGGGGGSAASTR